MYAVIDVLNDVVLTVNSSMAHCEEVVRSTCYEAKKNGQPYSEEDTPVITAIKDLSDEYRKMVEEVMDENGSETKTLLTKEEAYRLGFEHGSEMAEESGAGGPGCEGWDGMLINADPTFVREKFGWDGIESPESAKELLAEYCRGAQDGANQAVGA